MVLGYFHWFSMLHLFCRFQVLATGTGLMGFFLSRLSYPLKSSFVDFTTWLQYCWSGHKTPSKKNDKVGGGCVGGGGKGGSRSPFSLPLFSLLPPSFLLLPFSFLPLSLTFCHPSPAPSPSSLPLSPISLPLSPASLSPSLPAPLHPGPISSSKCNLIETVICLFQNRRPKESRRSTFWLMARGRGCEV